MGRPMARRRSMAQGAASSRRRASWPSHPSLLSVLAVVVPAVIVVAVGAALLPTLVLHRGGAAPSPIPSASSAGQEESNSLPAYMLAAGSEVQQAYRYAAEQPAALEHIPCYCGCGGHSGHRRVRDCFLS